MGNDSALSTVGEALGLRARDYAATYVPGSEPTARSRRKRETFRASPVDPRTLDPLADHARAGVPDKTLARTANVTPKQVAYWRRELGIHKRAGRPGRLQHATAMAVELFGDPFQPIVMKVAPSPVLGRFEPPEYVVRHELDYGLFASFVRALVDAGHPQEALERGLGVRELDIAIALALTREGAP